MSIIYGKKTIGFPTTMKDIPHLASLLKSDVVSGICPKDADQESSEVSIINYFDNNKVLAWTFSTKQGAHAKVCSYFLFDNVTSFSCSFKAVVDLQFSKGLTTQLREKYTYSEDALLSAVNFAQDKIGMKRIECQVIETDRRMMYLLKKCGFVREGVRRGAALYDNRFLSVHIFGLVK